MRNVGRDEAANFCRLVAFVGRHNEFETIGQATAPCSLLQRRNVARKDKRRPHEVAQLDSFKLRFRDAAASFDDRRLRFARLPQVDES